MTKIIAFLLTIAIVVSGCSSGQVENTKDVFVNEDEQTVQAGPIAQTVSNPTSNKMSTVHFDFGKNSMDLCPSKLIANKDGFKFVVEPGDEKNADEFFDINYYPPHFNRIQEDLLPFGLEGYVTKDYFYDDGQNNMLQPNLWCQVFYFKDEDGANGFFNKEHPLAKNQDGLGEFHNTLLLDVPNLAYELSDVYFIHGIWVQIGNVVIDISEVGLETENHLLFKTFELAKATALALGAQILEEAPNSVGSINPYTDSEYVDFSGGEGILFWGFDYLNETISAKNDMFGKGLDPVRNGLFLFDQNSGKIDLIYDDLDGVYSRYHPGENVMSISSDQKMAFVNVGGDFCPMMLIELSPPYNQIHVNGLCSNPKWVRDSNEFVVVNDKKFFDVVSQDFSTIKRVHVDGYLLSSIVSATSDKVLISATTDEQDVFSRKNTYIIVDYDGQIIESFDSSQVFVNATRDGWYILESATDYWDRLPEDLKNKIKKNSLKKILTPLFGYKHYVVGNEPSDLITLSIQEYPVGQNNKLADSYSEGLHVEKSLNDFVIPLSDSHMLFSYGCNQLTSIDMNSRINTIVPVKEDAPCSVIANADGAIVYSLSDKPIFNAKKEDPEYAFLNIYPVVSSWLGGFSKTYYNDKGSAEDSVSADLLSSDGLILIKQVLGGAPDLSLPQENEEKELLIRYYIYNPKDNNYTPISQFHYQREGVVDCPDKQNCRYIDTYAWVALPE